MNVHPIPHGIFEPQCQRLFKFCITVQCHEREAPCIFVVQTFYTLDKKSPSKGNFQTLDWLGENSPNSCHI